MQDYWPTFKVLGRFSAGISEILLALNTSSSSFVNFNKPASMTDTWMQHRQKCFWETWSCYGHFQVSWITHNLFWVSNKYILHILTILAS